MRVLRFIRGVSKRDRHRNVDIRRELRVTPLLDGIDNSKLFGHVMRREEERLPRKYLFWTPQGKRPVRRPRNR